MGTIGKKSCPTCGQSINEREIVLFSEMVVALWDVWKWCREKGKTSFRTRDIKHLFKGTNASARFGDWILFGGLVYRPNTGPKKGYFCLNTERMQEFFAGRLPIPTQIWKNPVTGELRMEKYKTVNEVPHLKQYLYSDNEYVARYRSNETLF